MLTEEDLTLVRGTGDRGPPGGERGKKNKTPLAEVFKLLGKSGYGKLIEVMERQTNIISNLEEIGTAYEWESQKPRITIRPPFPVGITVYQVAKLRILEFYYDFINSYFHRRDFKLIQMDTDSNYTGRAL